MTALALRLANHLDELGLGLSFDGIDLELTASELEADLAYGRVP